jgi:hypothetical protein
VIRLVSEQVKAARKESNKIDVRRHWHAGGRANTLQRIILVGGSGDSPYLNKRLKAWCQENGEIMLVCPNYCHAAIGRGAALCGLTGIASSSRQCRRHYGLSYARPFQEGIDNEVDAFFDDWDGSKMCSGIMD